MFVLNHALDLLNSPPAFLAQKYAALLRKLPQITCKSHTDHYHALQAMFEEPLVAAIAVLRCGDAEQVPAALNVLFLAVEHFVITERSCDELMALPWIRVIVTVITMKDSERVLVSLLRMCTNFRLFDGGDLGLVLTSYLEKSLESAEPERVFWALILVKEHFWTTPQSREHFEPMVRDLLRVGNKYAGLL